MVVLGFDTNPYFQIFSLLLRNQGLFFVESKTFFVLNSQCHGQEYLTTNMSMYNNHSMLIQLSLFFSFT